MPADLLVRSDHASILCCFFHSYADCCHDVLGCCFSAADDAVLQPMLGFPVMQGEANGQHSPPQLLNNYQVDKLTSWNTVQAVCAALFARERGKSDGGQHIEIAMLDVGANFFWPDGMALTGEMFVDKDPSTLSGSRPSRRPPQVLMPTKDGHGVLMIWPEAPHFEKALNAILPELKDDPRFMKMPERTLWNR